MANDFERLVSQLVARGKSGTSSMASLDLRAAFVAAAKAANSDTSKQLVALGRWMETHARSSAETQELHQRVLLLAQRSTLASYDRTRKGPSGYRQGTRFSGGKLRGVLAGPSFITATPTGIGFIDANRLNNEAWQWKRLNFGAGQAGEESPRSQMYPLRISNMVVAVLGLEEGPRPAFTIPVGFFNAKNEFHPGFPTGAQRADGGADMRVVREPVVTRGIRARHFLDAGIQRIGNETWPAYQEFIFDLVERGEITNLRPVRTVTHSARPTPFPR